MERVRFETALLGMPKTSFGSVGGRPAAGVIFGELGSLGACVDRPPTPTPVPPQATRAIGHRTGSLPPNGAPNPPAGAWGSRQWRSCEGARGGACGGSVGSSGANAGLGGAAGRRRRHRRLAWSHPPPPWEGAATSACGARGGGCPVTRMWAKTGSRGVSIGGCFEISGPKAFPGAKSNGCRACPPVPSSSGYVIKDWGGSQSPGRVLFGGGYRKATVMRVGNLRV